jgi:murein DD-endopeptidase MepM/ murein hydrolase activator NlpD
MTRRKVRDLTLAVVATIGTLGGLLVNAAVSPAMAADRGVPGRVHTGGIALNVRGAPNASATLVKKLSNGQRITLLCQVAGQKIVGAVRTTTMWDRLAEGRYVSDAYVARSRPVPRCGKPGQVQPPASRTPQVPAGWLAPIPGGVGSGFRTRERPAHDGVDIAAKRNTPILAAANGTVITAECNVSTKNCDVDGSLKVSGCGWYVEIEHADRVVTRYCHLVKRPSVAVGAKVRAGQVIGYVGTSGNSSGPHLHFEVHTDAPPANRKNAVEPGAFLRSKGVTLG